MRHIVIVLACLTQGHGRRIQAASTHTAGTGLKPQEPDPLKTLAVLLAAESPTAAFGAASLGARSALSKAAYHRACGRFLRAAPCLLQAVALEENPVVVSTKILTCATCRASYEVDVESLPDGQKVRCSVCDDEWTVNLLDLLDMPSNMEIVDYPSEMKARLDSGQSVLDVDLFVAGLAPGTTERALKTFFEKCGPVSSVSIVLDYDGNPRGFGFVTMKSWADAQMAIETLGGSELMGKTVTVKASKTQKRPTKVATEVPKTKWTHEAGKPLADFHKGQIVQGRVTNIASQGVYVNFGAQKDGLLPPLKMSGPMPKIGDLIKDLQIDRINLVKSWVSLQAVPPSEAGARAEDEQEAIPLAEMKQGTPLAELRRGQKVEGTVTHVADNGVWIDIGAQRDALIPTPVWAASNHNTPKVGDVFSDLEITIVDVEDQRVVVRFPKKKRLQLKLSKDYTVAAARQRIDRLTDKEDQPDELLGMYDDDGVDDAVGDEEPQELMNSAGVLSAFDIDRLGQKLSESDAGTETAPTQDKEQVVSPQALSIPDLREGQKVVGTVTRIENRGVYINIGAEVDGLLPSAACTMKTGIPQVGDVISDLEIGRVDLQKKKFRLKLTPSVADAEAAPQQEKEQAVSPKLLQVSDLQKGQKVEGTVTRIDHRGVYINVAAETDGLLPSAACTMKTGMPKVGDVISDLEVDRIDVDKGKFRLKLSSPGAATDTAPEQAKDEDISTQVEELVSDMESKLAERLGQIKDKQEFAPQADTGAVEEVASTKSSTEVELPQIQVAPPQADKGAVQPAVITKPSTEVELPHIQVAPQADKGPGEPVVITKSSKEVELPHIQQFWLHPEGKAISEFSEGQHVEGSVTGITRVGMFVDIGAQKDALLPTEACEEMPRLGSSVTDLEIHRIDLVNDQLWLQCSSKSNKERLQISELREGQRIEGTVTQVDHRGVFIDIGANKDGLLPLEACKITDGLPKLGELIKDLQIQRVDLKQEKVMLIHTKQTKRKEPVRQEAKPINNPSVKKIEPTPVEPTSPSKDAVRGVNRWINPDGAPVSELKVGQAVEGEVTNVAEIGAFINIGAERDAVLPADKIRQTEEGRPEIGDFITDLEIEDVDVHKKQIWLRSALEKPEPDTADSRGKNIWVHPTGVAVSQLQEGQQVEGNVTNVAFSGVFINIGARQDGFIPIGDFRKHLEVPRIGDFVQGLEISRVDAQKNRFWMRFSNAASSRKTSPLSNFHRTQRVSGAVTAVTTHGVFVDIGSTKDGLLPASDAKRLTTLPRTGDIMKDLEVERVDLVKEQLWLKLSQDLLTIDDLYDGREVEGNVKTINSFGAFINIGAHQEGLLPASELSGAKLHPGEKLSNLVVQRLGKDRFRLRFSDRQLQTN